MDGGASRSSLYTPATTESEVFYGLELLPSGKRRSALVKEVEAMFGEDFAGRILPFDSDAAAYSRLSPRLAGSRGGRCHNRMVKSPPSPVRAAPLSPHEILGISKTVALPSSIPGSPERDPLLPW
jgi:hypothetical protein